MRRAFVSHSSSDDSYVAELEAFLRAAGFDEVFNDVSSIRPDQEFWPAIAKSIEACDSFVVVITHGSSRSEWVTKEVELARSLSKTILPIWVEDCPLPGTFVKRDVIDFRPRSRAARLFDLSRIYKHAPDKLVGRHHEMTRLDGHWEKALRCESGRPHVLTYVALGGEGKTSLVAKWAAELAARDWPGCEAAFAWSFYSQGESEQRATSSDLFLTEALAFLGDAEDRAFAGSAAGAFEKGQRLARLVSQRRCLLILDGLEPLQHPPTSTTPGRLRDQGIAALLRTLAGANRGLCVVTTRYSLPDIRAFWQTSAPEVELPRLSTDAGVHLLRTLGVHGTRPELTSLVEDAKGHALTLQLLGSFLKRAFNGDIRQRDRVNLEQADARIDGGHAFRVMATYEKWLQDGSDEATRQLALLRCMGLFDRPANWRSLELLFAPPAIGGLTEPLLNMMPGELAFSLDALEQARLLSVERESSGEVRALDTHPHIREYFAKSLRGQHAMAWRAAHERIYIHLCASTQEGSQPGLEDLQPLYQALAHGCNAGLHQEVHDDLYRRRIEQGERYYTTAVLGALGSDLDAVACFFDALWHRVAPTLRPADRAWLLNDAAFCLRGLGRLTDAVAPLQAAIDWAVGQQDWKHAAIGESNMCELALALGRLREAEASGGHAVAHARASGDAGWLATARSSQGFALHQLGRVAEATQCFSHIAPTVDQITVPVLKGLVGFRYSDLILAPAERAALGLGESSQAEHADKPVNRVCSTGDSVVRDGIDALTSICDQVGLQAEGALSDRLSANDGAPPLELALDYLSAGRAALYSSILRGSDRSRATSALENAVRLSRRAGQQHYLPFALLSRAWLRVLDGVRSGDDSAQEDLDEAWEIAERSSMQLHLADIALARARLFGYPEAAAGTLRAVKRYPWQSPSEDLAIANSLILSCGYRRREPEVAHISRTLPK